MSQSKNKDEHKIDLFVYEKSFASIVQQLKTEKQNDSFTILQIIPAFLRGFIYESEINNVDATSLKFNNVLYYDYSCAKIYGFSVKIKVSSDLMNLIEKLKDREKEKELLLLPVIVENFDLEEIYALTVIKRFENNSLKKWFDCRGYPRVRYADTMITAEKLYNIMEILKENKNKENKNIVQEFLKAFGINTGENIPKKDEAIGEIQKILVKGDTYLEC